MTYYDQIFNPYKLVQPKLSHSWPVPSLYFLIFSIYYNWLTEVRFNHVRLGFINDPKSVLF